MFPLPASIADAPACQLISLPEAIQTAISAVSRDAEQVRRSHELKTQAEAQKEAELESGKRLFNVRGPFSREELHEDGRRGEYLRARFHLLFMPVQPSWFEIIAPAGIGKTRECVERLRELLGCTVYYVVPTHDLVNQLVLDLEKAGYHSVYPVRGRTAPGMCALDDIAEISSDIASAGLGVQSILCGDPEDEDGHLCPHFHECGYQEQRRTLRELKAPSDQPLIFVMPHAYLANWPRFVPAPDLQIIDESCWQQFVQKSKLQPTDLQRIATDAPKAAKRILRSIAGALGQRAPLLGTLRGMGFTERKHFQTAAMWLTKKIEDDAARLVKEGSLDFRALRPLAATLHLVEQLSREIEIVCEISHSVAFPDCESPNTRNLIGIYSRRSMGEQIPVVLLDASADSDINSRIGGGKFETLTVDAARNAEIYQVRRKAFSRQSIVGKNGFGEPFHPEDAVELRLGIEQFIIARQEHHFRLLVVAQKSVAELLKGRLQPLIDAGRLRIAHFGALRGLNTFEDCDAAIIVGREQPSPGAVEALARALYWDDPTPLMLDQGYQLLPATRRMADGSIETEIIQQHPDPRINGVLFQVRECELTQAFDRIRLIHNLDPKFVYLLTCIPIDAEITTTASWARFRDASKNRIGRAVLRSIEQIGTITVGSKTFEAAVLPFGRELGRCFSEIWPSPESAHYEWRDGGDLNGGRFQIDYIFGFHPHLIFSYRRPRRRGKPSHALVSVRPAGPPHTCPNDADDPTTVGAEHPSTGQKSPPAPAPNDTIPTRTIAQSAVSDDDLRAAAIIALERITGDITLVSIEDA